jgi:hypothetical protein
LTVFAFTNLDLQPCRGNTGAETDRRLPWPQPFWFINHLSKRGQREAVFKQHSLAKLLQGGIRCSAFYLHQIGFILFGARMH